MRCGIILEIQRLCSTCQFNFDGICASGDVEGSYRYGDKIVHDRVDLSCWVISFECFVKLKK